MPAQRMRRPGGRACPLARDVGLFRSRHAFRGWLLRKRAPHVARAPARVRERPSSGRRGRRGRAACPARVADRGPAGVRRPSRPAGGPAQEAGGGDRARDRGQPLRGPPRRRERAARRPGRAHAGRGGIPRRLGGGPRRRGGPRPVRSPAGADRSGAPRARSAACRLRRRDFHARERSRPGGGGVLIRFVLHRPRSSQNIGAAARALANTGAGSLWVVEPVGFDRAQAARLAASAADALDRMRIVRTLPEALDECVDVVMTTGRRVPGAIDPRTVAQRLLAAPGDCALVFGDEVNGLPARELRRASAVATIPTAEKSSLNLAQAVLVFGYEILLAKLGAPGPPPRGPELANERLLRLLRDRAQALLPPAGFLNPQPPARALDEMLRVLGRAGRSGREVEMILGALDRVARTLR